MRPHHHHHHRGSSDDDEKPTPPPPTSRLRLQEFKDRLKKEAQKKRDEKKKRKEAERREKLGLPPLEEEGDEKDGEGGGEGEGEGKKGDDKSKKKKTRREYLREFAAWMKPYRGWLVFMFILALLGTGFSLIQPLFARHIIDDIVMKQDLELHERYSRLGLIAVLMVGFVILRQAVSGFRSYRMSLLNLRIMNRIRRRLFKKMVHLPLKILSDMKVGGAISRLSGDVGSLAGLVQMAIISPGIAIIQLLITTGIVFYINWRLSSVAIAVLPVMALASWLWIRKGRPIFKAIHEDNAVVNGRLTETFGGIRVVRTFQREHKEELDYTVGQHTIIRKNLFAHLRLLWVDLAWTLIMATSGFIVIGVGSLLIIHDTAAGLPPDQRTTIGDIFAFQAYVFMVLGPVYTIINTMSSLQNSLASMERVMDIMDEDVDKPDKPDAIVAPPEIDEMRFEDVTFGYNPEKPVIHNVNLTIPGRSTVALVGKSGSGKTTMTDLIARFHDPTSGVIRLNGTDLCDYKLAGYRSLLGMVQQEVFLFDGTVKGNIAYGMPHATDEQIEEAAKRANAHEFIEELEDKYDTYVGERGVKLSGGQRQRLSIARAFLANPKILILDEATSNLDTESEQLIQESLQELMNDRNTFVIAHRLSTVTHADLIVVMEEGKIVETGSHRDLMDQEGIYHEMIERQRQLTL